MAAFPKATGFYDSGTAFVEIVSPHVKGIADASGFANILHKHGYGVDDTDYVERLVNVIGNVAGRLDCPN